ncbi:MAG TPA: L,D-transpeptidase/peptidoglycan binding protein [Solirubrobacterales bacterium]|nr:L,D-transpeptidase/peptidoglycan binding protein [Solirubrobacterales bacterium]
MEARLRTHHKLGIAIVVAVTALLLLSVGVYAYDNSQKDRIAPGVTVGGVDIGGMSTDEARTEIQEELVAPLQKPVVVRFGPDTYRLSPKRLDHEADVDGMVDEALERSREGSLVDRVSRYVRGGELDAEIAPRIGYSDKAIDRFVAELAEEINRDPQDASIEPSGDRLLPTPGEKGRKLRADEVRDAIVAEVEEPGSGGEIVARAVKTEPEITTGELAEAYPTYITVDRDEFTVRLFVKLKLAKSYTVAIGAAGYDTPSGLYDIESKEVNPTWHVPDSAWAGELAGQDIPPGPGNPLVARWMGIYNGAGFHGTYETGSLGSAASHGCIRMSVDDVIDLFDRVEVGTPVYVQ